MAKVALNTMVAPETMEAIRKFATGKSQGQVVDEAVGLLVLSASVDPNDAVHGWFQETWQRLDEILETVQTVPEAELMPRNGGSAFDPARIPGVSVGLPVVMKRYRCEHCGRSPAVPRVGDICGECREDGHLGEPRNCGTCAVNSPSGGAL